MSLCLFSENFFLSEFPCYLGYSLYLMDYFSALTFVELKAAFLMLGSIF